MSQAGIPGSVAEGGPAVRSALKQRVLTAIVLVPVLLAALFWLPGLAWQLLLCVPIAIGGLEWSRLAKFGVAARAAFLVALLGACLGYAAAFAMAGGSEVLHAVATLLLMFALLFWAVAAPLWLYRGWHLRHPLALGITGWIVLVPAWLGAVLLQRSPWLLLAILFVVWIADTAAYFSGRRFGRRKLAPQISPGKTWEGVIGAMVAVLIYGFAASFLLQPYAGPYDRVVTLIFVGALTVLSIVGDLFESWIKRGAGAKDSGSLLPGHGGVLDRIDSLTATLPFAALYVLPMIVKP